MKKNRLLILFLHRGFVLSFWGLLIFFVVIATHRLLPLNYDINGWKPIKQPDGFTLNVDMRLNFPDSIVTYSDLDSLNYTKDAMSIYFKNETIPPGMNQRMDSLGRLPDVNKRLIENKMTFFSEAAGDDFVHHTNSTIHSTGSFRIKSSSTWINTLIELSEYFNIVLAILVLYQLKHIFSILKKSFSFNIKIVTRVKWLGIIIMGSELLSAISSAWLSSIIDFISLSSYQNGSILMNGYTTKIYPVITFEWSIFIVGCSLLVLSSLLQLGNSIESEHELTI